MLVEIIVGDDLRRVGEASSLPWVQLPQAIQDLFGIQDLIVVRYKNNKNDWITLASEADYNQVRKLVGP